MIVDYPDGQSWTIEYDFKCWVASALVFEDSSGNISFVKAVDHRPYEYDCKDIIILDYGKFKQIIFGGWGRMGIFDDNTIYGVIDGKNVSLFDGRQFYYKRGCFLYFSGHQDISQLMVFDTTKNDYRVIEGYPAIVCLPISVRTADRRSSTFTSTLSAVSSCPRRWSDTGVCAAAFFFRLVYISVSSSLLYMVK